MIGLIEGDRAVAGVIHQPATHLVWVGLVGLGAWQIDANGVRAPIRVSSQPDLGGARVVSSRSHRTSVLERTLRMLGAREVVAQGSAGLKGARVATGEADAYVAPHYAGQRWDVCAVDALTAAAGGRVTDAYGAAIDYRAESLTNELGVIASNGLLHDSLMARLSAAREPESSA
jgi:3'(2'), 5'-bisphosphate nucleotidase